MSRRSRIVGFGTAGLLVVAGIGCAFIFTGGLAQNLAFVLVALGMVLATSLVFYEVGLTEDRERARERAREEKELQRKARLTARPQRRPLDRMRGRSRRLR